MRNCEKEPIPVGEARGKSWWFYKGALYSMSEEDLLPADVEALIEEQQNKKKLKIARAAIQRARPEQKRAAQFGATYGRKPAGGPPARLLARGCTRERVPAATAAVGLVPSLRLVGQRLTATVRRCVKNPRVSASIARHESRRCQHADSGAGQESACSARSRSPDLQALHAGGGTRTPDTRIMMTASRGHLRLIRALPGVLRSPQFRSKSGVGRTVRRTVCPQLAAVQPGLWTKPRVGGAIGPQGGEVHVPRFQHARLHRRIPTVPNPDDVVASGRSSMTRP